MRVIAVGFSNGANIAGSLLLLAPKVLAGAVLFRAMVPIVPDPLPALPATPVLISNGRVDPLVPVAETDRLAALLRSAGAKVPSTGTRPAISSCTTTSARANAWLARILRSNLRTILTFLDSGPPRATFAATMARHCRSGSSRCSRCVAGRSMRRTLIDRAG